MKLPRLPTFFVLLFNLHFFTSDVAVARRCPGPEWVARHGSSYCYFVQARDNPKLRWLWDEASRDCKARGGALATIADEKELDFLSSIIYSAVSQQYFIGLSYETGKWTWIETGDPYKADLFPASGPLNIDAEAPQEDQRRQRAFISITDGKPRLFNAAGSKRSYICKAKYSSRPRCLVEAGWDYRHDRCWKLQLGVRTWTDAREACRAEYEGTIMVPRSLDENQLLMDKTEETHLGGDTIAKMVWLGLGLVKETAGEVDPAGVMFENGKSLAEQEFTNFAVANIQTTLNNFAPGSYVTYINLGGSVSQQGKWQVTTSKYDQRLPFACETARETCPYSWYHFGDNCYRKLYSDEERLTWDDGSRLCADQGGHLAFITSREIQEFLAAMVKPTWVNPNADPPYYWIGYRSVNGGKYSWSTAEGPYSPALPDLYTNWDSTTAPDPTGTTQSCVVIDTKTGKWKTSDCTEKFSILCQAHKDAAIYYDDFVLPDYACEPPFLKYYDGCYLPITTPTTWTAAKDYCDHQKSRLVEIRSMGENVFVKGLWDKLLPSTEAVWIGVKRDKQPGPNGDKIVTRYSDGKLISPQAYQNFETPPNEAYDPTKTCYAAHPPSAGHNIVGKWFADSCDTIKPFICQHRGVLVERPGSPTANNTCARGQAFPGDWYYNSATQRCFFLSSQEKSWDSAQENCRNISGNLATVSDSETVFVSSLLKEFAEIDKVFIGLRLADYVTKRHEWVDGSLSTYRRWADGEPHPTGLEACVTIDGDNGKWVDDNCGKAYRFLCMAHEGNVIPDVPPEVGGCPKGQIEFRGFCYFFSPSAELKTWREAQSICTKLNPEKKSNLLSIHSAQDNSFIISQLAAERTDRWLGLYQDTENNGFYWSDNSVFDYNQWHWSEPFNENGAPYQCVKVYGDIGRAGKWNDDDCRAKNGYICKSYSGSCDTDPSIQPADPDSGTCPPEYQPFGDTCFSVQHHPAPLIGAISPMTAAMAKDECAKDGANVATINSIYENAFVHTLLNDPTIAHEITDDDAWINLRMKSLDIVWDNGCPMAYTAKTAAVSGNPLPGTTTCGFMSATDGTWAFMPCTEKKEFVVCEKRQKPCPKLPSHITDPCPLLYSSTCSETCFNIEQTTATSAGESATFKEAVDKCKKKDGVLVSIISQSDNDCVANLVSHSEGSLWTGLYQTLDVTSGNAVWRWTDDAVNVGFVNWKDGPPPAVNSNTAPLCAEISPDGKWLAVQCDLKLGYICQASRRPLPLSTTQIPPQIPSRPATESNADVVTTQEPEKFTLTDPDRHATAGTLAGVAIAIMLIVPGLTFVAYVAWNRTRVSPNNLDDPEEVAPRSGDTNDDRQPVIAFSHEDSYT